MFSLVFTSEMQTSAHLKIGINILDGTDRNNVEINSYPWDPTLTKMRSGILLTYFASVHLYYFVKRNKHFGRSLLLVQRGKQTVNFYLNWVNLIGGVDL